MRTVLITGGAGFIGSHVARRLLGSGAAVRVLDNFDPFYDPALKRRNVDVLRAAATDAAGSGLPASSGVATRSPAAASPAAAPPAAFELVEGDLRDPDACRRAVQDVGGVIHLAALAGVRPSLRDPARYMDVNVTGTQVLLDAVRAHAAPGTPLVFGSSSSVYGGCERVPFRESEPVDRPMSPYAASKRAGELICWTWHRLYGNPVTCLRFFTVYGPGQRPEMAIAAFSRLLLAGEPLPFFGDGTTRRDYTYVDDIVDGVVVALQRAHGYHVYNLGGAATTTLAHLVQLLEQAYGKRAVLRRLPEQPGDVPQTYADVALAERELGWHGRVPIEEGVRRYAAWYGEERAAGRLP